MIPLYDLSHQKGKIPLITILLIFLNTVLFLISLSNLEFFIQKFGFIPEKILSKENYFTLFSAMFLHASFFHLISNMWFLWLFGDNVETKIGKIKFLILYFISGIFAFLFHSIMTTQKSIPVVGASGAISGILGAYLVFFPQNKIVAILPFFYFYRIVTLPAIFYILIWFFYQFLYININPFVAWWAHIGGFLCGFFLSILIKKR